MGEIGAKGCTFSATRLERVKADSIWPLQKREGERLAAGCSWPAGVMAAAAEPDKGCELRCACLLFKAKRSED